MATWMREERRRSLHETRGDAKTALPKRASAGGAHYKTRFSLFLLLSTSRVSGFAGQTTDSSIYGELDSLCFLAVLHDYIPTKSVNPLKLVILSHKIEHL